MQRRHVGRSARRCSPSTPATARPTSRWSPRRHGPAGTARGGPFRPHRIGAEAAVAGLAPLVEQPGRCGPGPPRRGTDRGQARRGLPGQRRPPVRARGARGRHRGATAGPARRRSSTTPSRVLRAGLDEPRGVAVVCGAGINCAGPAPRRHHRRFAAVGHISGDWGGGGDLWQEAMWWAARADDGRGPGTALSHALPRHFGLADMAGLIEAVHLGDLSEARCLELTPVLFAVAAAGTTSPSGSSAARPRRSSPWPSPPCVGSESSTSRSTWSSAEACSPPVIPSSWTRSTGCSPSRHPGRGPRRTARRPSSARPCSGSTGSVRRGRTRAARSSSHGWTSSRRSGCATSCGSWPAVARPTSSANRSPERSPRRLELGGRTAMAASARSASAGSMPSHPCAQERLVDLGMPLDAPDGLGQPGRLHLARAARSPAARHRRAAGRRRRRCSAAPRRRAVRRGGTGGRPRPRHPSRCRSARTAGHAGCAAAPRPARQTPAGAPGRCPASAPGRPPRPGSAPWSTSATRARRRPTPPCSRPSPPARRTRRGGRQRIAVLGPTTSRSRPPSSRPGGGWGRLPRAGSPGRAESRPQPSGQTRASSPAARSRCRWPARASQRAGTDCCRSRAAARAGSSRWP